MVVYSATYPTKVHLKAVYSAACLKVGYLMVAYSTEVYLKAVCQEAYRKLGYSIVAQFCFRHFMFLVYIGQADKHHRVLKHVLKSFYA